MGILNTLGSVGSSLVGYSSITTSGKDDDFDTLGTSGVLLTSTATSVSASGCKGLATGVQLAEIEQSKSYVQSLSAEQQHELLDLLDEKEQQLVLDEKGNQYIKKI